jgi:hypothetical protein
VTEGDEGKAKVTIDKVTTCLLARNSKMSCNRCVRVRDPCLRGAIGSAKNYEMRIFHLQDQIAGSTRDPNSWHPDVPLQFIRPSRCQDRPPLKSSSELPSSRSSPRNPPALCDGKVVRHDLLLSHWITTRRKYYVELLKRALLCLYEKKVYDRYKNRVENGENAIGRAC